MKRTASLFMTPVCLLSLSCCVIAMEPAQSPAAHEGNDVLLQDVGAMGRSEGHGNTGAADQILTDGTLAITSYSEVSSGMASLKSSRTALPMSLRVAPMVRNQPDFTRAVLITTDNDGSAELTLQPGVYWIGATEDLSVRLEQQVAPALVQPLQVRIEANGQVAVDVVRRSFAP